MLELARKASALWPIDASSIELAARRENMVFRAGAYALRLHRKGYRSDAELESELSFMAALAENGLDVPEPIRSRNGHNIEIVDGVRASVLTWLGGRPLGETGRPLIVDDRLGTFRRLGEIIARLHAIIDRWTPPPEFTRLQWDTEGLLGDNPAWGRFWENPKLTPAQRSLTREARKKLRAQISAMPNLDFGLIHADLVSENILVEGLNIRIIDFDDSGFGFRLQDIATALIKNIEEPDFASLREALCQGYLALRPLDEARIDAFLLIRALSLVGWIIPRMADPGGEARCNRFITQATRLAEVYLAV
jgi:Ser/Thr protein kinase RdoA (MazF antagonist)